MTGNKKEREETAMTESTVPTINTEIPLLVVGFDFRIASSALREKLVTTSEDREYLYGEIKRADPSAGFLALETCNRIEWIVSASMTEWVSQLLSARMLNKWQQCFPHLKDFPSPYIYRGKDAVNHVLRVVVGLESLATGEAQIAGQFQNNLKRAQKEKTSCPVINRLSHVAGRIARSGYKMGFRSNYRKGIHGLVVTLMENRFPEVSGQEGGQDSRQDGGKKTILVAGMGNIGRRAASLLEEVPRFKVVRLNRTVSPENLEHWKPLEQLGQLCRDADALVVATGGIVPVVNEDNMNVADMAHMADGKENGKEDKRFLVMDIGIPHQVSETLRQHSFIDYRNIDDLKALTEDKGKGECIGPLEVEIGKETLSFAQFCRERAMSAMLTGIHRGRLELTEKRIPLLVDSHLSDLDESRRNIIENTMKQFIRDYSNDLFTAFHNSMEQYWVQHHSEQ